RRMNLDWAELLCKINDMFVNLTREKIFKKETNDFKKHVRSCLKLNDESDWNYILASEDILEDSNAAIQNFLKFGISGPTKYDELGEKYLRLYGLLNAVYLQQNALLSLAKFFQHPNYSKMREDLESLQIRRIRNQLGAHSVDFFEEEGFPNRAFVPVRISLEDFHVEFFEHTKDEMHKADLKESIEEHLKLASHVYLDVIEKSIRTIYKNNPEKIESLIEAFSPFRERLKGNIVYVSPNGDVLVIRTIQT
ncbi:hypothetical protein, partial [Pelagicoccus enzymogenes]